MKKHMPQITLCILGIIVLGTAAYPQETINDDTGRMMRRASERKEGEKRMRPRRPWQQRMKELQDHNPELFEEMKEMRKKDPAAFAGWLQKQIAQRRRDEIIKKHPAFGNFLDTLPTESRDALEKDLFRTPHQRKHHRNHSSVEDRGKQEETLYIEPEMFDAQTKRFENELERAEKRIQQLRELMKKRQQLRDQVTND